MHFIYPSIKSFKKTEKNPSKLDSDIIRAIQTSILYEHRYKKILHILENGIQQYI